MASTLKISIVALFIISTVFASSSSSFNSNSRGSSADSGDMSDYAWDKSGYYKHKSTKNKNDANDGGKTNTKTPSPSTTSNGNQNGNGGSGDANGNDDGGNGNVDTETDTDTDTNTTDSCDNSCTDGVQMPNFCDYASYQWDDPNTPLEERNNIGRASLLTSANVLKANALVTQGKIYKLSYEYTNSMPAFGTRSWYTSLRMAGLPLGEVHVYYEFDENNLDQCGIGTGYLDQRLMTSANGNSGTQFDAMGHIFYMNGDYGDARNYLFHNGFTGDQVMKEWGVDYIGVEKMPSIVTRAILLDVAGYVGKDPLPENFEIDTDVVKDVLEYQGLSVDDIEEGDVVLTYTGWANANYETGDPVFYYSREPGLTLDTVINIFGPNGVVMLGADNFAVEFAAADEPLSIPIHVHWVVCNGGFLYENMKLNEWVNDARNNDSPYIGAFYYTPAQIKGGVGGLGTPIVIV